MELKHLIFAVVCLAGVFQAAQARCTPEELENCKLPDCLCPSTDIPGGHPPANIPQIVYLTFDDAVNTINYQQYQDLFFDRVNPNGEPITLSFYVTHEYTDYTLVHQLWRRGHDISLHSITHASDTQYWKDLTGDGWRQEIVEQKQQIAHFAKIPESRVTGMRAPFLQTGGDVMMGQIYGELQYDCSRPTRDYMDPALWPYTMDYDTEFQDCQIQPCAKEVYPGFWNVPMVDWMGVNEFPCAMIDTCLPQPNNTEQTMELFLPNFLRHYEGNRAPFGVFTHSAWLSADLPGHRSGYEAFLDYLSDLPDVYIVSIPRALEWIKNPTTLDAINSFEPWKVTVEPDTCTIKNNCRFAPEDTPFPSERYMNICGSCPNTYPWLGDPLGETGRIRANKFDRK